jgi:pSer/pThr/pTyr-binding forkhead associated (FHA) protein
MSQETYRASGFEAFLANFRSTIIVLCGEATGMEFVLDARVNLIGRGPGVDLALDDPSLAREHAVIEFATDGFHLRGRTAGASIAVNGAPGSAAPLKPGDRFQLGEVQFGFEIEARE